MHCMINLEIVILLGGYNQFIKGNEITKKNVNDKFSDEVPRQITF